ncbi:transport protein Avl9-domain-containing protein [Collybia nuda]|uniref:Transport protein Avl9-domain-containing protein n=1 Tax=Collybia nuda TaxID=64659 RepID=A0A9P5Y7Y5_9AGAR|nr:transport protein Avl9-domain-containing protein [Collybia nuda]
MASMLPEPSPAPFQNHRNFLHNDIDDDDDADTASQRSISLSSPADSPRHSALSALARQSTFRDSRSYSKRESHPYTVDTDFGSEPDTGSMFNHEVGETPSTSAAPSVYDEPKESNISPLPTYPPSPPSGDDRISVSSFASSSSRKTRPESLLVNLPNGPLILGIALVDFNHLVLQGFELRLDFLDGEIFENEEVAKILPFLALPDGAHLTSEDYSYFHLVPSGHNPTTVFGISCNQQISASALLVKGPDVTRSTVQKAVVVLASKPVFGPIRAKLGVVTTALFNQRDFTDASILEDFGSALELSLRGQLTESGLYMGTSLREFVHMFRQKTLVLVKALMLQKRIMFYGHPVERLCTYQYSLVSLLPGLLQTLEDCGSPPLAARAPTLSRATSLRTSDHKSMMAYMGLPLDIFGKDAFFQPYLPLQQLDVLKETHSWLCGSTNSIVTQQEEIDLLVNIETGSFEFRDAKLERSAALTAADRKWMDDIVTDVNNGWDDANPTNTLQFKGSDDYLRTKFEEYVSAALASVKYRDFVAKGEGSGVLITGGSGGDSNSTEDFNPLWISEFKTTNAYEVWERTTDPLLFDIVEPRHPCNEKPSVVADISLRLQEGIQELKLEQQLAPAREAVTRTLTAGSTNFFKAVEGVRGRWAQRSVSETGSTDALKGASGSSTPVEVSKADLDAPEPAPEPAVHPSGIRPFTLGKRGSVDSQTPEITPTPVNSPARPTLSTWGAGIGSFLSTRAPRFSLMRQKSEDATSDPPETPKPAPAPTSPPAPIVAVQSEPLTPQTVMTPAINVTSPGGTGTFPRTSPVTSDSTKGGATTTEPLTRMNDIDLKDALASEDHHPTVDLVTKKDVQVDESPPPKAVPNGLNDSHSKSEPQSKPNIQPTKTGQGAHSDVDDDEDGAYTGMAI